MSQNNSNNTSISKHHHHHHHDHSDDGDGDDGDEQYTNVSPSGLSYDSVSRYRRQIILPDFRASGQNKLLSTSFLVVGAGGLGSPALLYLAGAGVGKIGIVDGDNVDVTNLHRQVIHNEERVGISKVLSAKKTIQALNSGVEVETYNHFLNSENALSIVSQYQLSLLSSSSKSFNDFNYFSFNTIHNLCVSYICGCYVCSYDIVLDCSDNVSTRYLVNDACILSNKPLVSASALKTDGQLTIYGYGETGPCYRCLYPQPPPPETVGSCAEQGVLGVVPGILGTIQALEAIKLSLLIKDPTSLHKESVEVLSGKLLIFSAMSNMYKVVKLRPKNPNCVVCGNNRSINNLIDYDLFCGTKEGCEANSTKLSPENEISIQNFKMNVDDGQKHVLVDVRGTVEYEICRLPSSLNIPLNELKSRLSELKEIIDKQKPEYVYVLCRSGRRSAKGSMILKESGINNVKNIVGGLLAWKSTFDNKFAIF